MHSEKSVFRARALLIDKSYFFVQYLLALGKLHNINTQ